MTGFPDAGRWLRRYRPSPDARMRLLCFPHAGGAASSFRSWPARFPADVEVLSVRLPGREDRLRERCIDRMEPLAEAITSAVLPLTDRPLAFFGHSMGASVAHEVALRLESRHAVRLRRLFVSSRPPPHRLPIYHIHLGSDEDLIDDVRRLDKRGSAALDDPDLRALVLPAIRADYQIIGNYHPETQRVKSPLTAYAGDADPEVSVDDVAEWRAVTEADFTLRVFSGDHFYLVPHEAQLVSDISRWLTGPGHGGTAPRLASGAA